MSIETNAVVTTNIRETDGFKLFYQEIIKQRIAKQHPNMYWIGSDNIGDQFILCDDDERSHVYQYKQYLKTKKW